MSEERDPFHTDLDNLCAHFVKLAAEEAEKLATKHGDPGLRDFILWAVLMKGGRQGAALMGQVDYLYRLMRDPQAYDFDKKLEAGFQKIRDQQKYDKSMLKKLKDHLQ